MTYLFKLSRRVSGFPSLSLAVLALAACSPSEERDFLSPNPGVTTSQPIVMSISPRAGSARPGEAIRFQVTGRTSDGRTIPVEVDWSATGGTITGDGSFVGTRFGRFTVQARARTAALTDSATVSVFNSPNDILLIVVSPDSAEITEGEGIKLEALTVRADGLEQRDAPLNWSSEGGSVDGSGWFTAAAAGTYTVKAETGAGVEGSATIKVRSGRRVLTRITVSPETTNLTYGQTRKFEALATYEDATLRTTQVTWSATGGAIGSDGTYTASSSTGNYRVIARDKQSSLADTAFVSVTEPTMTSVAISPGVTSLVPGATQQFVLSATMSDGSTRTAGASWQAAGGTVTAAGLFTAGTTEGTFRVVASVSGTGLADTAVVTVAVPTVTLSQVLVNPGSASVPAGTGRQFTATALYSDGSTRTPSVTWSATGGAISASGLFTAGITLGSYRVIAREAGGKADTSDVSVTAAQLEQLVLNPSSVSLEPAGTHQFTASGLWSDGSARTPVVIWTGQGGTISAGGLYTAGSAAGTFPVIARHEGGSLADTSYVTIDVPAPVLTSLDVSPSSVTVSPQGIWQFSVSGTWSNGGAGTPPVAWSATGGSISNSGLYTAAGTAGTFRVIATQVGGSLADTSVVTISSAAPVLTRLDLSPASTSLQTTGTRQFSVAGTWSDGSTGVPAVTWSATGGTVTNGGLYVAGTVAGTYRVIATQAGGGAADTAVVTVSSPATLVGLAISPDSGVVQTAGSRQFSAVGTWSTGGTGAVSAAWSATGGMVTSAGLYTAGASAGSFRVVAASGSVADTATVRVTASATLTSFTLNPASVSLARGAAQQFATAAAWSDGQTRPYTVTYSATGGTISSSGLYTAGQLAGSFMVVASCTCGGTDTTAVAISAAPPPVLQSISLSPDSVSMGAGGQTAFSVVGSWSDGSSNPPSVTYSATAGSISALGVYTAPAAAGTYRVIATAGALADTSRVIVSAASAPSAPQLPQTYLNTAYVAPTGRTIRVAAGGNLQAALDNALPGDEVVLQAGAVFRGSHWLKPKSGTGWITIRSDVTLPPEGTRMTPTLAANLRLARLEAINGGSEAPLKTAAGAANYRIMGLEFAAAPTLTQLTILLRIHVDGMTSASHFPSNIIIDRVYVHGHPTLQVSSCVRINSRSTAIIDSWISQCTMSGGESQGIASDWGTGPFKIVNNYVEASGENIMFGGGDGPISGTIPTDVEIRRNHLFKPLSWRGVYAVKNLFESKKSRRVLVEGNVMENNWVDAQSGSAIVLKSTNQNGSGTWSVTDHMTMRDNIVRNSPQGVNIAAAPEVHPAVPANNILLENNLFQDVGFAGYSIMLAGSDDGGLSNIGFVRNTFVYSGTGSGLMSLSGRVSQGLVFRDNVGLLGSYGVKGDRTGIGTASLAGFWSTYEFSGNGLVGSAVASSYPAGNAFASSPAAAGLQPDGSLSGSSPFRGRATGGGTPGVDVSRVLQATQGVVVQP